MSAIFVLRAPYTSPYMILIYRQFDEPMREMSEAIQEEERERGRRSPPRSSVTVTLLRLSGNARMPFVT